VPCSGRGRRMLLLLLSLRRGSCCSSPLPPAASRRCPPIIEPTAAAALVVGQLACHCPCSVPLAGGEEGVGAVGVDQGLLWYFCVGVGVKRGVVRVKSGGVGASFWGGLGVAFCVCVLFLGGGRSCVFGD
jgi:hypothetical protein